jgi:hypothetical protein
MFLYIEDHNQNRQQFKILEYEDLKPLFEMFPRTEKIALSSDDLKHATQRIARYLSSGHIHAWVEYNQLEKGLKEKAAALGLSLATAMTPTLITMQKPEYTPKLSETTKVEQKKPSTDFGIHPADRFLWNTMQIESSGGLNTEHKTIKHGKFKGERAIGKWGLLKPTVNEIVNRMRISGNLKPEHAKLETMSRDNLDAHFKENPQVELDMARFLASHVLKRQKGNQLKAAYSWLYGHNLFPSDISEHHLANEDYVAKYKKFDRKNPFKATKRTIASVSKNETGDINFSTRFKNWYIKRTDEKTKDPMRDKTFVPDLGRRREEELDEIKPDSQKTPEQKLKDNIKRVNKK